MGVPGDRQPFFNNHYNAANAVLYILSLSNHRVGAGSLANDGSVMSLQTLLIVQDISPC